VEPGAVMLTGRAWSGLAPIERVEVSTDGGARFADAELDPPLGEHAWRGWRFDWNAPPGEHVLSSRATDAAGNTQPLETPWNLKGYANNAVERITVVVGAA
jgi:Mo-co oxidoreductase dimerisation domain